MKLSGGLLLLSVQENICVQNLQKTTACCYSRLAWVPLKEVNNADIVAVHFIDSLCKTALRKILYTMWFSCYQQRCDKTRKKPIQAPNLKERKCKFAGLLLWAYPKTTKMLLVFTLIRCCTKCCICSIDCGGVSHARNYVTFGNAFSHLLATEILLTDSSLSFISTVFITLVKCYFHATSSGGDDSAGE